VPLDAVENTRAVCHGLNLGTVRWKERCSVWCFHQAAGGLVSLGRSAASRRVNEIREETYSCAGELLQVARCLWRGRARLGRVVVGRCVSLASGVLDALACGLGIL